MAAFSPSSLRGFRGLALATIAAVYFLIFVGGLVRASGAGMGCPDWPKCFGRWVPPTSEQELPSDYREQWAAHGYAAAPFNALKTWTEYTNRMIGVVIGLLIFATLLASLRLRPRDRSAALWSAVAFVLVGFNGWLGSVVVSSNLEPWVVTAHMLAALLVVAALLLALERVVAPEPAVAAAGGSRRTALLFTVAMALALIQLVLGAQVREEVDLLLNAGRERASWADSLGGLVLVHRSFAIAVLLANAGLAWRLRALTAPGSGLGRLGTAIVAVTAIEVVAGAGLYYLGFPAALQPVHLLCAAILLGLLFHAYRRWHLAIRAGADGAGIPAAVGVRLERGGTSA